MVSGVLHNACLRMDEEGAGLDDLLSPSGIHRWLGRGGIAIGGAASLLVGAVFGGILESVPVLLPPPAAAVSSPHIDSGGGAGLPANTPWTLAADTVPAVQVTSQPAPAIGAPAGSNFSSVPTPNLPPVASNTTSGPATNAGSGIPGGAPSGTGSVPSTTPSVPGTPPTPPAPSPLQPVVTAVQGAVNTATGTVQNTVGTVSGATQTLVSGTTGSGGSTSTSTSSPVSTATNTVTGTVTNTTSSLGL